MKRSRLNTPTNISHGKRIAVEQSALVKMRWRKTLVCDPVAGYPSRDYNKPRGHAYAVTDARTLRTGALENGGRRPAADGLLEL